MGISETPSTFGIFWVFVFLKGMRVLYLTLPSVLSEVIAKSNCLKFSLEYGSTDKIIHIYLKSKRNSKFEESVVN